MSSTLARREATGGDSWGNRDQNMGSPVNLSVLLTCHNQESLIGRVVKGLVECTRTPLQLVIVYDGCTDASEAVVQRTFAEIGMGSIREVRTLYTPDVFETKANNVAMRHADGDTLILVQDDMVVTEVGWDERLTYPLRAFSDVISVTAKYAHNIVFAKRKGLFGPVSLGCPDTAGREFGLDRGTFAIRDSANRGPLALDAGKVRELGYLDEAFAPYTWDEHDLHLRAFAQHGWLAGCYWIGFESPPEWGTTRRKNSDLFQRVYTRNMDLLYRRHRRLIKSAKHTENRRLEWDASKRADDAVG